MASKSPPTRRKGSSQTDPDNSHYLQRIQDAATHMGCLLEGLLDLARLGRQGLHVRRIDLRSVASEVIEELKLDAPGRQIEWISQLEKRFAPRLDEQGRSPANVLRERMRRRLAEEGREPEEDQPPILVDANNRPLTIAQVLRMNRPRRPAGRADETT